jgi:hypothetical protein
MTGKIAHTRAGAREFAFSILLRPKFVLSDLQVVCRQ